MEHDFQIQVMFGSMAILAAFEAMKAERWHRYIFWAVTALLAFVAFFWPALAGLSDSATAFVTSIATNGETWLLLFAVLMIALAANSRAGIGRRKATAPMQPASPPGSNAENAPIPPISTPQLRQELTSAMQTQINAAEARLIAHVEKSADLQTKALERGLGDLKSEMATRERKAKQDFRYLLDWATTQGAVLLFKRLRAEAPVLVPMEPPTDPRERGMVLGYATAYVKKAYAETQHILGDAVKNIASAAEEQVENELRYLPGDKRPQNIDAYEFRDHFIAARQCAMIAEWLGTKIAEAESWDKLQVDNLFDAAKAYQQH